MQTFHQISHAKQIERWEHAYSVLKKMSPHDRREHWDMGNWGVLTECGTVACAAGQCGLDPWFRKRGLKLQFVAWSPETRKYEHSNKVSEDTSVKSTFDSDVQSFFGYGAENIFYNGTNRPVSVVMQEIKLHIRLLKKLGRAEKFKDGDDVVDCTYYEEANYGVYYHR